MFSAFRPRWPILLGRHRQDFLRTGPRQLGCHLTALCQRAQDLKLGPMLQIQSLFRTRLFPQDQTQLGRTWVLCQATVYAMLL